MKANRIWNVARAHFHNTFPSCIYHSTLATSFVCISSETLKLDSLSAVKCTRRVWGRKVNNPFCLSERVRMFLRCLMSPIHSDRRGTSNNYISIKTGPVARSQPADVRPPLVS